MQVKEFKIEKQLFDFRDKMNNLIETSMVQAELKGLKLKIDVDKDIPN